MRQLGELEAVVMQRLWDWGQPVSVRDVVESLASDRPLAYTTVMTVMDNLHNKKMVTRERVGRAYVYTAAVTRDDYTAGRIAAATADSDDRAAALLQFIGQLSPAEVKRIKKALNEPQPANRHGRRSR